MRHLALALMILSLSCSCVVNRFVPPADARSPADMLASSVQITASILYKDMLTNEPVESGWYGSGAVYQKSNGLNGPVRSRILSANHVLEVPAPGTMTFAQGKLLIVVASRLTARTYSGQVCDLTVLRLGKDTNQDVATAEADCDAGRVAKISRHGAHVGDRVFTAGHPRGVEMPLVTEGYVSGWYNGYLLTSIPVTGGNSGGPMFDNGQIVGVMVRADEYPFISLSVPFQAVLDRVQQSNQIPF